MENIRNCLEMICLTKLFKCWRPVRIYFSKSFLHVTDPFGPLLLRRCKSIFRCTADGKPSTWLPLDNSQSRYWTNINTHKTNSNDVHINKRRTTHQHNPCWTPVRNAKKQSKTKNNQNVLQRANTPHHKNTDVHCLQTMQVNRKHPEQFNKQSRNSTNKTWTRQATKHI